MRLEVGKTYLTRDGRKARCIATDIKRGELTCVCAVSNNNRGEDIYMYKSDGTYSNDFWSIDIVSEDKDPEYIPLSWETRDVIREKGGWVRNKEVYGEYLIVEIGRLGVGVRVGNCINWVHLIDEFEFLDGTPCGILK